MPELTASQPSICSAPAFTASARDRSWVQRHWWRDAVGIDELGLRRTLKALAATRTLTAR